MSDPTLEQRIADLQRAMEVGFERLAGQVGSQIALLGLRLDQAEAHRVESAAKFEKHETRFDKHDGRMDDIERAYLPRTEFDTYRAQQEQRSSDRVRSWPQWLAVLLSAASIAVAIIAIIAK